MINAPYVKFGAGTTRKGGFDKASIWIQSKIFGAIIG